MKEKRLEYLLEKLADNTISSPDYEELMEYILHAKSDKDLYTAMDELWKRMDTLYPLTDSQSSDLFNRIKSDPRFINSEDRVIIPERSKWSWLKVAASVLIISSFFGIATYLFKGISKNEPSYIEKVVLNGVAQQFKLPDSSTVWINTGGKLRYPSDFNSRKKRELYLEGEAYFDVSHDPDKPFIVHTGKVSTTVLGTAFDIKAYSGEIRVAVIRGKVSVNEGNRNLSVLTPNKMMVYTLQSKQVTKSEVKAIDLTTWKNGELVFDNTTMEQAAEIIGRRYNVVFSFESPGLKKFRFTASFPFPEKESITDIMVIIGRVNKNNFDYQIDGRKVIITDKK